jgi:hypothetical protein
MIFLFLLLLPVLIGAMARSKGRSFIVWFFLSFIITPIGGLILLLILPTRDRGPMSKLTNVLDSSSAKLSKKADGIKTQRKADAARIAELDAKIEAEARNGRVERLIAERLCEVSNGPAPSLAGPSAVSDGPPVFGKR